MQGDILDEKFLEESGLHQEDHIFTMILRLSFTCTRISHFTQSQSIILMDIIEWMTFLGQPKSLSSVVLSFLMKSI